MTRDLTLVLRRNMIKALGAGELEEAASLLEQLELRDPLALETRGLRLEFLLRTGRLDDAASLSRQLLELFPGSARIHYLAGQLASRRKDHAEAARLLRESLRIHRHWRTERALGQVLTHAGELDEAEAVLLALLSDHAVVHRDLAWLAERRGNLEAAIAHLEAYIETFPDAPSAHESLQRLKARTLEPEDLQEEVDTLLALGEDIAPELLPEYLESLLRTGQGEKARAFLQDRAANFEPRTTTRCGWVCYQLQNFDLAFELFVQALPAELANFKLLNALESAATRCHRIADLLKVYESHAAHDRRFYGRMRRLAKRVQGC
jgi:tetratricopeptide (TPR) repeat protein